MLVKDLYIVLLAHGDRKSHSYLTHDSYSQASHGSVLMLMLTLPKKRERWYPLA